ncbi:hypothetical protein BST91_04300 [Nonlabens tegetincola]|uniref:M56 family metallopeptidase n=1 Tax=Nonlabens tegetincola TaxID=323273 RepID=UPI000A208BBA|nr:M56 family metallopeptidase [Nonlabens tegetincola]ARN70923.1 hypothetical protein BST91_04300 [Nonlabens tegetincola]
METLVEYLWKSTAVLAVFVLGYHFILRKLTFFQANRVFLLVGIVASIVLPFVEFTEVVYMEQLPVTTTNNVIYFSDAAMMNTVTPEVTTYNWMELFIYAYLAVVLFFLGKLSIEIMSVQRLLNGGTSRKEDGVVLVSLSRKLTAFSFFNKIGFHNGDEKSEQFAHILRHEKVHAKEWHSIDVIITHIYCALFWINPLSWFLKKQVAQNLEFIADAKAAAVQEGNMSYARTLVNAVVLQQQPALANNFVTPFIKQRIIMLQKEASKKWSAYKYALILPVIILFLYSFNTVTKVEYLNSPVEKMIPTEKATKNYKPSTAPGNSNLQTAQPVTEAIDTVFRLKERVNLRIVSSSTRESLEKQAENLKEKYNVDLKIKKFKKKNGKIIKLALSIDNNKGSVIEQQYESTNGLDDICINGVFDDTTSDWSIGKCDARVSQRIIQSGPGNKFYAFSTDSVMKPYIFNGTFKDSLLLKALSNVKTVNLDSIFAQIEMGENSIKLDSLMAKMNIQFKDLDSLVNMGNSFHHAQPIIIEELDIDIDTLRVNASQPMTYGSSYRWNSDAKPLFILNGKEVEEAKVLRLHPNAIQTVTVLKDGNATSRYGDKGANGVVVVVSKPEDLETLVEEEIIIDNDSTRYKVRRKAIEKREEYMREREQLMEEKRAEYEERRELLREKSEAKREELEKRREIMREKAVEKRKEVELLREAKRSELEARRQILLAKRDSLKAGSRYYEIEEVFDENVENIYKVNDPENKDSLIKLGEILSEQGHVLNIKTHRVRDGILRKLKFEIDGNQYTSQSDAGIKQVIFKEVNGQLRVSIIQN